MKVLKVEERKCQSWGQNKAIGAHRRKVGQRTYRSPKIILNSVFNDLIGKGYETFIADIKLEPGYCDDWELDEVPTQKALILVLGERQTARPRVRIKDI